MLLHRSFHPRACKAATVYAACGFALLLALALSLGSCSDSSTSKADTGRYFRMRVGLTYKGQPVDIDFVAGCGVHVGHDFSGGSIREIAGMTDLFRGVRMPEGHAVVINSYPYFEGPEFNPCDGDTTDHSSNERIDTRVPKDWLPFIVWFERDDQFAHGVGYLTQDAYDNKNARFSFRYATIEHATKEEFEAFRKTGPANLLPPHQTDWMTGGRGDPSYYDAKDVPDSVRQNPPSGWWKTVGRTCEGVVRRPLTDSERSIVHDAWPKHHPDYWRDARLFTRTSTLWRGTPGEHARKAFPIVSNQALSQLTPTTSAIEQRDVMIGDGIANLGYVYCDVIWPPILEAVAGRSSKPGCVARIDGVPMSWPLSDCGLPPFLYQDRYLVSAIGFRS